MAALFSIIRTRQAVFRQDPATQRAGSGKHNQNAELSMTVRGAFFRVFVLD